jgi:hypothetical protein
MAYCVPSVTGTVFYLGLKGKGSVGCTGFFNDNSTCTGNTLGANFLNMGSTGSTSWEDTHTSGVSAPSGTRSILITCFADGYTAGAIDQIYVNSGSSTGFGGN